MLAIFDSGSKVNAIHPIFAKELGSSIRLTDVGAQKIHGSMLDTFEIVVVAFSMTDKANQVRFFKETFLVANVSPEVVLGMPFLILSSTDVNSFRHELRWRTYTTKEAFLTTKCVELVDKKEFAATALDPEHKIYILYVGSVSSNMLPRLSSFDVHPFRKPQIASLIFKKALTKILVKYSEFADLFSLDLASELLEYTGISNHTIKLVNGQQPS